MLTPKKPPTFLIYIGNLHLIAIVFVTEMLSHIISILYFFFPNLS